MTAKLRAEAGKVFAELHSCDDHGAYVHIDILDGDQAPDQAPASFTLPAEHLDNIIAALVGLRAHVRATLPTICEPRVTPWQ